MAWLGQQLVLCTSLRYVLLHPTQQTTTQLFALAAEAPSPTLVQSVPAANLALLLMVSLASAQSWHAFHCFHTKCSDIMPTCTLIGAAMHVSMHHPVEM